MKATLLHYPDTPMTELQITKSPFTGIIFVTKIIHYGVYGATGAANLTTFGV